MAARATSVTLAPPTAGNIGALLGVDQTSGNTAVTRVVTNQERMHVSTLALLGFVVEPNLLCRELHVVQKARAFLLFGRCDGRLAQVLLDAGYSVTSPSLSLVARHVHAFST